MFLHTTGYSLHNFFNCFSSDIGMVGCSSTTGCTSSDLGIMSATQCCIDNPNGLAYTLPGSDVCNLCIGWLILYKHSLTLKLKFYLVMNVIFGWFNDSFTGIEQEASHTLHVGYLKGAQNFGLDFTFRAQVQGSLVQVVRGKCSGCFHFYCINSIHITVFCL